MSLSREELEERVLRHCLETPIGLARAEALDITKEHFQFLKEGHPKSFTSSFYSFILNYYKKSNGSLMTHTVMEQELIQAGVQQVNRGQYELLWCRIYDQEYNENELYSLLMSLKNHRAAELLRDMVIKTNELLLSSTAMDVVEHIEGCIEPIRVELNGAEQAMHEFDFTRSAEIYEREYKAQLVRPKGIPCGLKQIDEKTGGWMAGQLVCFVNKSGSGKSLQLLNMAHHAHKTGHNVLYFSFELSWWECFMRHASLAFNVPYWRLKQLRLDEEEQKSLKDDLLALEAQTDGHYFAYDTSKDDPTPEYIEAKIREITLSRGKPDLVVIDYIGIMTTRDISRNTKDYEKQEAAVAKLHRMADKLALPVLTAQQTNRDALKGDRKAQENGKLFTLDQSDIAGGMKVVHYCTYMIGMNSDKVNKRIGYMPMKLRDIEEFAQFGAAVEPQFYRIVELSDEEQATFRRDHNLSDGIQGGANAGDTPAVERNDSVVAVENRGVRTAIKKEQLTINMDEEVEVTVDLGDDW